MASNETYVIPDTYQNTTPAPALDQKTLNKMVWRSLFLQGSFNYERMGVKCAIGHTDATYEQTMAGVAAGASIFVHTYNGMRGLHHRDPGVVGCAMSSP